MMFEISRRYSGIKKATVASFLEKCESCTRFQPLKTSDLIQNVRGTKPWERLQIDLVDLRKYSDVNQGFSWILNVLDTFSKYLHSYRLKSKESGEVHFFRRNANV
jgi:hypothetical protein